MKPTIILFITALFCILFSSSSFAQNSQPSYQVVMVKGKPSKVDKKKIHNGDKMETRDKVLFTSLSDVLILINTQLDRIRMAPRNALELMKPVKVQNFASRGITTGDYIERGRANSLSYQSARDTLKLNLVTDLKRSPETDPKNFRLLNRFMENIEGCLKVEGDYLLIFPKTTGLYSLHFNDGRGHTEMITEIEFMDVDELKAELKYVANNTTPKDSTSSQQLKYIRKLYPNVPGYQIDALISRNP